LDEKLERELARLQSDRPRKSEVAREALRANFPSSDSGLCAAKRCPYAAAAGYLTDEDVFRDVS